MAGDQEHTRAWTPKAQAAASYGPVPRGDAYTRLKALIARNAFRPGHHLMARDLADGLRVSATPVREALIRLSVEGAIAAVPHKGFYTKPLDVAEMTDSYELALVIAVHAVQKGVGTFSPADLEPPCAPEAGQEDAAAALRLAQAAFVDRVLERVATMSGNLKAVGIIKTFADRARLIRLIDYEDENRMGRVRTAYADLVADLAAGEVDGAVRRLGLISTESLQRLPAIVNEANARALRHPAGDVAQI